MWAYLDRNNKHIPLETDNEEDAPAALARLIESRKLPAIPSGDQKSIAELFEIAVARAHTNNADKTEYELGLDLERILAFLQGTTPAADGTPIERDIRYPSQMNRQIVEDYKEYRFRSPKRRRRGDGVNDGENLKLPNRVSERRINHELSAWRRGLLVATEEGMGCLSAAQIDGWIVRLKEPQTEPHQVGLTTRDIDRFFAACDDWRWSAVFRAVLGSAMRDAELRHLAEGDLRSDPAPHIVITQKPAGWCRCHRKGWKVKNWRYRKIPVSQATLQAARDVLRARSQRQPLPTTPAGAIIGEKRREIGLTIAELATRANCSERMLYHVEARRRLPKEALAAALERALGLPQGAIPRQSSRDRFGLASKSVWLALQRTRKAAGLAHFSLHDFRRAWASHMLRAGHSLASISKWMGHRDVQTTIRYLRIVDDDMPDPATLPF